MSCKSEKGKFRLTIEEFADGNAAKFERAEAAHRIAEQ
jgi:hypothetical protein